MPFGEYVPLPHWLPGAGLIGAIVGDFTPGDELHADACRAIFAREFLSASSRRIRRSREGSLDEGADVLINISNDGYLGPTAVMRQHLANAVFRAVENGRPLLRVTNTGITACITPDGDVQDCNPGFSSRCANLEN